MFTWLYFDSKTCRLHPLQYTYNIQYIYCTLIFAYDLFFPSNKCLITLTLLTTIIKNLSLHFCFPLNQGRIQSVFQGGGAGGRVLARRGMGSRERSVPFSWVGNFRFFNLSRRVFRPLFNDFKLWGLAQGGTRAPASPWLRHWLPALHCLHTMELVICRLLIPFFIRSVYLRYQISNKLVSNFRFDEDDILKHSSPAINPIHFNLSDIPIVEWRYITRLME